MAEIGKQIGAYTVVDRLNSVEGAQGRIYIAEKDGARFILKAPEHAAHRQAEIAAWKKATQKHHPNILPLIETLTDSDGQVYLVSPLVESGSLERKATLKDWLDTQPGNRAATRDQALSIFRGIAAGLAHVHAADLTHRDLKPGNILLSHLHPLLMDFGLARITKKSIATMGVGGTLGYAPPEIAIELMKEMMGMRERERLLLRQTTPISKRGDVWSAGVILYELLFGTRPFSDIDTLRDPVAPAPNLETLPPPLASFLQKALAKDPTKRFASGQELATAFKSTEADLREWEIQQRVVAEQAKLKKAEDEAARAKATAEAERKRRELTEKALKEAELAKEQAETQTEPPTLGRRALIGAGLAGLVGGSLYVGKLLGGGSIPGLGNHDGLTVAEACALPPTYPAPKTLAEYKAQMVQIPGGTFQMGGESFRNDAKPIHPVALSAFRMGRTPVTVSMWREFCTATGRKMPPAPSWGWQDDHPMVRVSWKDCKAYCEWASRQLGIVLQLPTEAQFEYASRGGFEGKAYPWGDVMDDSKLWCSMKTYADSKKYRDGTAAVSRPNHVYVNGYGLLDISGNVWQWCSDWYGAYGSGSATNPTGAPSGNNKVLRGGSWDFSYADFFRCANRINNYPTLANDYRGFRLCG